MAYTPGKNLTLTIGGNVVTATTSNITDSIGKVDVTNYTSGGAYECIGDIRQVDMDFEAVVDGTAVRQFATDGTAVAASFVVSGGHTLSGSFFIEQRQIKSTIRGAYTISGRGTFTGAVTRS